MHDAHEFLIALATVLCVAGVMTVVFQRLRQPVVLGYMLAGLIVGPHVPVPLVADRAIVQTLSELGVILLMFSLGLEFQPRAPRSGRRAAALTALIECSAMLWLGGAVGEALGWTARESLFAGALIAISSTTIIVKAFDEQRVRPAVARARLRRARLRGPDRDPAADAAPGRRARRRLVGGASSPPRSGGSSRSSRRCSRSALLLVPRALRAVLRLGRAETTLVASLGICFAFALLAHSLGYSVALGAFLAGSLVAESGRRARDRTPGRPGARPVRRDLLRFGRHADRSPPRLRERGRGAGPHHSRAARENRVRLARRIPDGCRDAHLARAGHEPRADRRVLVHPRRASASRRARREISSRPSRSQSPHSRC